MHAIDWQFMIGNFFLLLAWSLLTSFLLVSSDQKVTPNFTDENWERDAKIRTERNFEKLFKTRECCFDLILWKDHSLSVQAFIIAVLLSAVFAAIGTIPSIILLFNLASILSHPALLRKLKKFKKF